MRMCARSAYICCRNFAVRGLGHFVCLVFPFGLVGPASSLCTARLRCAASRRGPRVQCFICTIIRTEGAAGLPFKQRGRQAQTAVGAACEPARLWPQTAIKPPLSISSWLSWLRAGRGLRQELALMALVALAGERIHVRTTLDWYANWANVWLIQDWCHASPWWTLEPNINPICY